MIRAFLLSLLLCTAVFAKGPVCRVIVDHQGNRPEMDMGTGTLIADRYVATAAHIFFSGDELPWVRFDIGGKEYKALAKVVARDDLSDFALLKLDRSVPIEPVPIGPALKKGDFVKLCGYGQSPPFPGTWKCRTGTVTKVIPTMEGFTLFDASFSSRNGDSGGPFLDSKGRIVSVLSGNDDKSNRAGGGRDLASFLEKHLPKSEYKLSSRYPQRGRVDRFYKRGRG